MLGARGGLFLAFVGVATFVALAPLRGGYQGAVLAVGNEWKVLNIDTLRRN
jgi:hypothetical protein